MAKAIEVKNTQVFAIPQVQKLLEEALASVDFIAPGGLASVAEDLFEYVNRDDHWLVLGIENGEYVGLVMAFGHSNNLFPYPTVTLIYNAGTAEMRRELVRETMDILTQKGYTKAWAVNGSKRSDKAWQRLFSGSGVGVNLIGSAVEFKVE